MVARPLPASCAHGGVDAGRVELHQLEVPAEDPQQHARLLRVEFRRLRRALSGLGLRPPMLDEHLENLAERRARRRRLARVSSLLPDPPRLAEPCRPAPAVPLNRPPHPILSPVPKPTPP